MFKNMRLVILFDMFLNPSFKLTTSFASIARTTARTSKFFLLRVLHHFTSETFHTISKINFRNVARSFLKKTLILS